MTKEEGKSLRQAVASWWRALHPDDEGGRGDRAAAARLRRAGSLFEVMVEGEAIRLYGRACEALSRTRLSDREATGIAIVAGVLAAVKPVGRPDYTPFATMLGRTVEGRPAGENERALFSPLRFVALVRADDPEERLRHLRRAVALARGKSFDVPRFAEDMLRWSDETRRRWIFEYHQQGRAAPVEPEADTEISEEAVQ
ncbi:MAG: type I-E CRISPR-associated protein Cse2/CasB [Pseudorhodoplanes sp.]